MVMGRTASDAAFELIFGSNCAAPRMLCSFSSSRPPLCVQGDGIDYHNIEHILQAVMEAGYSVQASTKR